MGARFNRLTGIYKITNIDNDKVYIGQTCEMRKRWLRHVNDLNKGVHGNIYLQRAWNKYGSDCFKFKVLEVCERSELDEKERYWIKYYYSNDYKYGYNLDDGGSTGKKVNKDIAMQRAKKRIYKRGEECHNALFSNIDVYKIKKILSEDSCSMIELAQKYNVGRHVIYSIARVATYTNIGIQFNDALIKKYNERVESKKSLSDEEILQIKELLYNGNSCAYISKRLNISSKIISNIKRGTSYAHITTPYDTDIAKTNRHEEIKYNYITSKEVEQIKRELAKPDANQSKIAKQFNINRSTICNIKTLSTWRHVASEYNDIINQEKRSGENSLLSKINTETVISIKRLLAETNMTMREISEKYCISMGLVSDIKQFRAWKHVKTEHDKIIREKNNTDIKLQKNNLTIEDIIDIKKQIAENIINLKILAKQYNVGYEFILHIKNRDYFSEIGREYNEQIIKNEQGFLSKITLIKRDLANTDNTILDISVKYGISRGVVTGVNRLQKYKDVAPEYNDRLLEKLGKTKTKKTSLLPKEVYNIKKRLAEEDITPRILSDKMSLSFYIIQAMWLGRTWTNVGKEYNDILKLKCNGTGWKEV